MKRYSLTPIDINAGFLEPDEVAHLVLGCFPSGRPNWEEANRRLAASLERHVESGTPEFLLQGHRALFGVAVVIEIPTAQGMISLYVEPDTSIDVDPTEEQIEPVLKEVAEVLGYKVIVKNR